MMLAVLCSSCHKTYNFSSSVGFFLFAKYQGVDSENMQIIYHMLARWPPHHGQTIKITKQQSNSIKNERKGRLQSIF